MNEILTPRGALRIASALLVSNDYDVAQFFIKHYLKGQGNWSRRDMAKFYSDLLRPKYDHIGIGLWMGLFSAYSESESPEQKDEPSDEYVVEIFDSGWRTDCISDSLVTATTIARERAVFGTRPGICHRARVSNRTTGRVIAEYEESTGRQILKYEQEQSESPEDEFSGDFLVEELVEEYDEAWRFVARYELLSVARHEARALCRNRRVSTRVSRSDGTVYSVWRYNPEFEPTWEVIEKGGDMSDPKSPVESAGDESSVESPVDEPPVEKSVEEDPVKLNPGGVVTKSSSRYILMHGFYEPTTKVFETRGEAMKWRENQLTPEAPVFITKVYGEWV